MKNLIPGMVKTRLAKDVGMFLALDIYQELVNHTAKVVRKVDADKMVFYSEYVEVEDAFEGEDFEYSVQTGNSLGERMQNAFQHAFDKGYSRVTIIGSDCYDLKAKHLEQAFDQLEINDIVVGPAKDGGYYLLGLNGPCPALFEGKEYSHDKVFEELMSEAKDLELECHVLDKLNDIDTLEDVKGTALMKILEEPEEGEEF
ncbi:MAG: TIGR04282 family arsenosugar biosynthesis glycosyltransferase [Cyclobacteriaceae bacterium]